MFRCLVLLAIFVASGVCAQTTYLKVSWDPNTDGNVTRYNILRGVSPDNLAVIETVDHPTVSFEDYTITTDRRYYYSIQAINGFGLTSSESAVRWGEIRRVEDLTITEVDTYAVSVSWTTQEDYQTQVVYGSSYPLENYSDLQSQPGTQHQVLLENLNGQTRYYFSALSIDPGGNVIASTDTFFTTAGQAPVIQAGEEQVVIAYPNPYKGLQNGLWFDGLEVGDNVLVYNVSGENIWESEAVDQRRIRWEVNTGQSENVGSGVYVYIVRNADGKKVASGKIVVVR